ncbi:hypothetical protein PUNSTDRAFT_140908 [Punctularia strigosozonata HHB-11173 SS5]|uniref:uncharacterized protein n=1 Tax=Punctularia strigosozonata (strain HHB-11173) TaxID=741275 RepID=UPI0004417873|nr:uncharacterized protein PUNSTDRAFT_140908 [Punctularia strigosozonata HHB-11173 SS5]EIN14675.1 hypothetical protein PUNSTDRAFT_140908 [Punctularia strigosozonata HHB-11173 SS5]
MSFSRRYSALLDDGSQLDSGDGHRDHATITAPVFTGEALALAGESTFPQHALYGRVLAQEATGFAPTIQFSEVLVNSNAPFSALVCGVQGSGKSHSTSVLLESCLIKDDRVGTLPAPLSGLVFHFDTAAGGGVVQPCEAAYLASLDPYRGKNAVPPRVTVLVLPNSLKAMRKVYAGLPGVDVQPLHFAAQDISAERLLCMMKVDGDTQMPLYMEFVMAYLRSMDEFSYNDFRCALQEQRFNPGQKAMLNLRLSLLDACLEGGTGANRISTHFGPGKLVIIDLSSPFMDAASACGFFDMILGLFIEADVRASGKIIVLDEAHKYLTEHASSSRLTESLLSVIRQQRHLATRVVVSTQEPTVVPSKFLDLCSFIIAHRFSSPTWLTHLLKHVAAGASNGDGWFSKIVSLRTGEALLFAPSGLSVREIPTGTMDGVDQAISVSRKTAPLGPGYLHVRSRLRITRDGGHSMLAVRDPVLNTRIGPVASRTESSSASNIPNAIQSSIRTSHAWKRDDDDDSISRSSRNSWESCHSRTMSPFAASASPSSLTSSESIQCDAGFLQQPQETLSTSSLHTPTGAVSWTVTAPQNSRFLKGSSTTPEASDMNTVHDFRPLIEILTHSPEKKATHRMLKQRIRISYPGTLSKKKKGFAKYLDAAVASGIVTQGGSGAESWAQLKDDRDLIDTCSSSPSKVPSTSTSRVISESVLAISSSPSMDSKATPAHISETVGGSTSRPPVPSEFQPLVNFLADKRSERVSFTDIGLALTKMRPKPYHGKLKKYIEKAADAGLLTWEWNGSYGWAQLQD